MGFEAENTQNKRTSHTASDKRTSFPVMTRRDKIIKICEILDALYPDPPIPLNHRDPYTLLIAVLLGRERIRRPRVLAMLVAFAGVLLIIRPGSAGVSGT